MSRSVFRDFADRNSFERFTLALTGASRKAVLSAAHEKVNRSRQITDSHVTQRLSDAPLTGVRRIET
jgi:hypothetical protein